MLATSKAVYPEFPSNILLTRSKMECLGWAIPKIFLVVLPHTLNHMCVSLFEFHIWILKYVFLSLSKTACSAQERKSISFTLIVWSTLWLAHSICISLTTSKVAGISSNLVRLYTRFKIDKSKKAIKCWNSLFKINM